MAEGGYWTGNFLSCQLHLNTQIYPCVGHKLTLTRQIFPLYYSSIIQGEHRNPLQVGNGSLISPTVLVTEIGVTLPLILYGHHWDPSLLTSNYPRWHILKFHTLLLIYPIIQYFTYFTLSHLPWNYNCLTLIEVNIETRYRSAWESLVSPTTRTGMEIFPTTIGIGSRASVT